MRAYSKAVKIYVRRRMSPPNRQSVAEMAQELVIHVIPLYKMEEGLADAGGGCAGIRKGSRGLERF